MRGNWHLLAISVIVGLISITLNFLFIYGLYLFWLYLLYRKNRINFIQILLIISSCLISSLYYYPLSEQESNLLNQFNVMEGKIISEVDKTITATSFILREIETDQKISVTYFNNQEKLPSDQITSWKTGATCSLQGEIELPPTSKNPGQFNYRKYLKKQEVNYQVILEQPTDLTCTSSSFINNFYQVRKNIILNIEEKLSAFSSSWLQALLLGRDTSLKDSDVELFQRWNLSHLLAISGLHIGLISGFLYFIFINTGMLTKEKAYDVLIVVLMIYPLLSGGTPSVWRAVLMTVLGVFLLKSKWKVGLTDVVSIVFLLCLLMNKQIIFHLGFQFSFIVTLSLLLSRSFLMASNHKSGLILRISFVSIVSVLPLQIANFYFINPLAILLNIVIVPYFTLVVMPLLFVLFLSSSVAPFLSPLIDKFFQIIHQFILNVIEWIDSLFYFPWIIGEFPYGYFVPYYFFMVLFFASIHKKKKINAVLQGLLMFVLVIWLTIKPHFNPNGTVTMLDVGQGDAIIIELPYREAVVIFDAAGTMSGDFQTPSDLTYKQVIKPFLYSRGIGEIDAIILSHADHDHIGSTPYLLQEFSVKSIITSRFFSSPELLTANLIKKKLKISTVEAGQQISIGNQLFSVLHPNSNQHSKNDNSLVILSEIGALTWLFTGDISEKVEIILTNSYPNLTIDVLKVAHHGSNTSTSNTFIKRVQPDFSLISVGENNRYNHPHNEVLQRLILSDDVIYRTDLQGAIQYTFKDNGEQGTFSTFLP